MSVGRSQQKTHTKHLPPLPQPDNPTITSTTKPSYLFTSPHVPSSLSRLTPSQPIYTSTPPPITLHQGDQVSVKARLPKTPINCHMTKVTWARTPVVIVLTRFKKSVNRRCRRKVSVSPLGTVEYQGFVFWCFGFRDLVGSLGFFAFVGLDGKIYTGRGCGCERTI